jgi:hypothetical protein
MSQMLHRGQAMSVPFLSCAHWTSIIISSGTHFLPANALNLQGAAGSVGSRCAYSQVQRFRLREAHTLNVSDVENKLPAVHSWITAIVEQYRHIAQPVGSFGFTRLPAYFAKDTLEHARVVIVDLVPKLPLSALGLANFSDVETLESDGTTYRNVYFLNRARVNDESLHFHELIHVIQWDLLGGDRFLLAYALAHLSSGGYRNNPFERIAYHLQALFVDLPTPFQVEPVVRQHLKEIALSRCQSG